MKNRELQELRYADVRNSEAYNKHYHPILCYLGWFFGTPLVLNAFFDGSKSGGISGYIINSVMLWAMGWIPFAIIAAIATLIYCKSHSDDFGVPLDPVTTETIVGVTAAGITSRIVTSKVASHRRKSVKEI